MKQKKQLALEKAPYEELQALIKELGWPKYWLAHQMDKMIAGLIVVAKQAKKDAEELKGLTEEQAQKRYEDMMRMIMESDR